MEEHPSSAPTKRYEDEVFVCECAHCQTLRRYREHHPEAHLRHVRAYYYCHKEDILLAQAYARYQSGVKSRQNTIEKLIRAGFPVTRSGHTDDMVVNATSSPLAIKAA